MTLAPWQATVFTLFPEAFPRPLELSVTGRALKKNLWNLKTVQVRDFAQDNYKSVDTPRMVMRAEVLE